METFRFGVVVPDKQSVWLAPFKWQAKKVGKKHGLRVKVEALREECAQEQLQRCDFVLHKLSQHLASSSSSSSSALLAALEAHLSARPSAALDTLHSARLVNSRFHHAALLRTLLVTHDTLLVCRPPAVCVEQLPSAAIQLPFDFPCLVKPRLADGTPASHDVSIVYSAQGMQLLEPGDYVVEPFVPHGGTLVKVYVLGDDIVQIVRPSIDDSLGDMASAPESGILKLKRQTNHDKPKVLPEATQKELPMALLQSLVREVRWRFGGLELFGIDLIQDKREENVYRMIDVNYWPGYYGVGNVFAKIAELCFDKVARGNAAAEQNNRNNMNNNVDNNMDNDNDNNNNRQNVVHSRDDLKSDENSFLWDGEWSLLERLAVGYSSVFAAALLPHVAPRDVGRLAQCSRRLRHICAGTAVWRALCSRMLPAEALSLAGDVVNRRWQGDWRRFAMASIIGKGWMPQQRSPQLSLELESETAPRGSNVAVLQSKAALAACSFSQWRHTFSATLHTTAALWAFAVSPDAAACGPAVTSTGAPVRTPPLWLNGCPSLVASSGMWACSSLRSALSLPSAANGCRLTVRASSSQPRGATVEWTLHFFADDVYVCSHSCRMPAGTPLHFGVWSQSGTVLLDDCPCVPQLPQLTIFV